MTRLSRFVFWFRSLVEYRPLHPREIAYAEEIIAKALYLAAEDRHTVTIERVPIPIMHVLEPPFRRRWRFLPRMGFLGRYRYWEMVMNLIVVSEHLARDKWRLPAWLENRSANGSQK